MTLDHAAWEYIGRLRDDRVMSNETIELPPWSERQIGSLIALRSREAKIEPDLTRIEIPRQFDEIGHDSQQERNRYGIYRLLWDASGGNPEVALNLWADSLRVTPTGRTIARLPQPNSTGQFESTHGSVLLLLRMLLRVEAATREELVEYLGLSEGEIGSVLHTSVLQGWVEQVDGRYRVRDAWFRPVTRVLSRRNLLAR